MIESPIHSLLRRQLRRCFGGTENVPAKWREFVAGVDAAYREFDKDRAMLERALDLSSQELLQAGAEMRAVFKAIPDLLIRFDESGTILECKTGSGSDSTPPIATAPSRLALGARHRGCFADAANECARTKKIVGVEYALEIDDRRRFFEARVVPVLETQLVAFVRDITDRKQAEAELRHSVSLLTSTLESTADGILVLDQHGNIVRYNERFAQLWQVPAPMLQEQKQSAFIQHAIAQLKDPHAFVDKIHEMEEHPERESFDVLHFTDGRVFERYSGPHRLGSNPIGRVWNFRDVTERVQLEERFRHAQKMEAIGRLAGGVAHDFNNLLTVLMANLTMVRASSFDAAQQQIALNDCIDATRRAAGLTSQLLTFSRRQPIKATEVDFNEVVTGVAKMLRRLIGEDVLMTTQLSAMPLFVKVDIGLMEQMLMNLAVNARDAMPNGGELKIGVTACEFAPGIPLAANARCGKFVRIVVADNGTGISPELLPRIFEPFFTTKEIGRGTGLGLATVFGIVEQHEGWVDVQSAPGIGTTMMVYLPKLERIAPLAEATPPAAPLGGSESILVVEDEAPVRVLMRKILERYGYRVDAACDAREALALWRAGAGRFDLLLTDIVMPGGVSGRELARRLSAEVPDLPVVFCSGYADESKAEADALRNQPNFLEKPFTVDVLLERVRRSLDSAKKRTTSAS